MSFPFRNKIFTLTQPDGSTLQVKGTGDQHYAVFETMDGYTVTKNTSTGYYEYAKLEKGVFKNSGLVPGIDSANLLNENKAIRESKSVVKSKVASNFGLPPGNSRWQTRRRETKLKSVHSLLKSGPMAAPPRRSVTGNYFGLCILIDFPDEPATIDANEINAFLNQQGYIGFGNNGSVYDYYKDNSGNTLSFTNTVTPYYTAKNNKKYYTDPSIPYTERTIELINEALDFFVQESFDFSRLTTDAAECIYAVSIFYAGANINNWCEGLWPHQWNLSAPYPLSAGMMVNDYQITNIGNELSLGTFCHETGHLLCDFPDLYDTDQTPFGYGVGDYCLMCYGGIADEKNPAQVCAYLKFKAGWANSVKPINSSLNAEIKSGINDFFIYNKNATEYFIIENRMKSGRDAVLPDSGLTIWHVDEFASNNNGEMTSLLHYECSLIQADGKNDLELQGDVGDGQDLFDANSNNNFGENTNPKSIWWDGTTSGLELTNISEAREIMTFSVV